MGLFDFLRRKNKKSTPTSSESANEENEYLLKVENNDNPHRQHVYFGRCPNSNFRCNCTRSYNFISFFPFI